ncbi:peptidylprolyl isomerase [Flavobacterium sp. MK4S-17]|uniref:peptidylprolyl isomerase n=1 Tax=Flavobacterium sp. MK4S-17 TaxID=2543737 RepID=UPI00135726F3|nr:peptidylprolyl isomerase [Flavobacterium sp. MK4S-17]
MAVLSKIRQRSLLLILVIGFCLLAFIIGDIINSGGFGGPSRNVGSVNGTDIPVQDFMQKVNDYSRMQQGISSTQATNLVWNQEVDRIIFAERFDDAGLRVGRDHVINMYSQNPQVGQNPQFLNAAGKFDKGKFNEFLLNMKTANPAQWEMVERERPNIENQAKRQLYITMLKAGVVATDADGMAKYKAENDKVSFDYVYVPYSTINDDQVKVSDDEIIAYMKKNEKKYEAEASRSIEYVLIENKPSTADELEMRQSINALLAPKVVYNEDTKANDTIPGFRNVENIEEFVNANSDVKYDTTYVAKKDLPLDHAEQIYNLGKGEVYGPYIDNGYYKLTKMVDRKQGASAKVNHILIAYKDAMRAAPTVTLTKEEAKAKADELLRKINSNPGSFAELAKENSDDPGSANNGGEYDNVVPGQMVKPFNDFVFNNPVGKTGVVETDFGYHVIKVSGKNEAVRLATIAQKIEPSEKTSDELFTKATKLEMDAQDKPFEELVKAEKLTTVPVNNLKANDENVQGIGNQRGIVKWAFSDDTKVGDVKKFDIPQGHVVVSLKGSYEKGLLPIEEAKETVLPILRDQKKAELVKQKMAGSTLDEVAQKSGSSIAKASDVTLAAPMITGIGSEPKVVGKAFALGEGKTSDLIEGKMGVFKIKVNSIAKAAELPNYSSYTSRMKTQGRGEVPSRIAMALKDKADIEDNRAEFN